MAALRFETVGLRFGKAAELLSDLSFTVSRGELALVIGAPCAGKTSLIALASLALAPSRGIVCLFGATGASLGAGGRRAARRRIGMAGADDELVDGLSLAETIALPLRLAGMDREERLARAGGALARIGLATRAADDPATLSRAERQRVALARATVTAPELLLVDDVDAGSDPAETTRRLRTLADAAARGAAVLATLGDVAAMDRMGEARWLRLDRGRLSTIEPVARRRGVA